ncbi:MAG: enoyl-CoA hydratase/isomerase family protein, partial [Novosphingobium sp.]
MTDDVLIRCEGHAGILSLNRPKALHALTLDMVHAMTAALLEWRADPAVSVVIVDHAEGRGFCAGGDIAFLRKSALNDGGVSGRQFFHDEYQLNHLAFTSANMRAAECSTRALRTISGIEAPTLPTTPRWGRIGEN